MNSQKAREIIKFSIYKNIQNKWFLAFNIISLIIAVLILNWNSITTLFKPEELIENKNYNKIFEGKIKDYIAIC